MSQQRRQSNLFTAEDWKTVYQSFRQIDLRAYDFDTIKTAMIDHIRTVYPDDFNDWINNQEFIFILDTISFLGQNLAFRMDLNSRDNFLSTAERKESILRLANTLAYNPKRNYCANGLIKITSVQTTQDIRDSNGNSLANINVKWNDPQNPDWREQFILIMNSTFLSNNQFGSPVKHFSDGDIQTSLYEINSLDFGSIAESFTSAVSGSNLSFEVTNPDIDKNGFIVEKMPDPLANKGVIYRNDGNGNDSIDTGFFMFFKQGTLEYRDFNFSNQIEDRTIDINVENINETDVWVQELTSDGTIKTKWVKVPTTEYLTYNSNSQEKNKFSVITRDKDMITIKFPNTDTGSVPLGIYRVWFRRSSGTTYTVRTSDMTSREVSYKYTKSGGSNNNIETIFYRMDLQYQVSNSQASETIEQIRERAPQNYYLQDRVISGEDYNFAPLKQGNLVLKSKSLNRTYSGHSRFIDINDPTGNYQNTNVYSDDGILYDQFSTVTTKSGSIKIQSSLNIVLNDIQPLLQNRDIENLYYNAYPLMVNLTGTLTKQDDGTYTCDTELELYSALMVKPSNSTDNDITWASVSSKYTVASTNEIRYNISGAVSEQMSIVGGFPAFRRTFNEFERASIQDALNSGSPFGITYSPSGTGYEWDVIFPQNPEVLVDKSTFNYLNDWIIYCEPKGDYWNIYSRGLSIVFESETDVRFYFVNDKDETDISTGFSENDIVKIIRYNSSPEDPNKSIGQDVSLSLIGQFKTKDGYSDPNKVKIGFELNSGNNLTPIDPLMYKRIMGGTFDSYGNPVFIRSPEGLSYWMYTDGLEYPIVGSMLSSLLPKLDADFGRFRKFISNSESKSFIKGEYVLFEKNQTTLQLFRANRDITVTTVFDPEARDLIIDNIIWWKNTMPSGITNKTFVYHDPYDGAEVTNPEYKLGLMLCLQIENSDPSQSYGEFYDNNDVVYAITKRDGIVVTGSSGNGIVVRNARDSLDFQWKHYASNEYRIDPAITNIMDIYVLTSEYNNQVQDWNTGDRSLAFPREPSTYELQNQFKDIESIKAVSDSVIWHSAKFKPLFGEAADENLKATFKVLRIPGSTLSDNELKQKVVNSINKFFDINNWDFGESFYYTELSTFIHQQLITDVASVVIVPKNGSAFGNLFEISSQPNELFINTANVNDVQIITGLTQTNLNY